MANFNIQWRHSTKKDIRKLPDLEIARIVAAVALLGSDPLPPGSQKLSGSERTYRLRVGDYRIVYELTAESHLVEIQRVRHRKDVYR